MLNNGNSLPLAARVSMREAMARFATGVVVVTTPGEQWHGMTANAFSSVSLEPPLVLCCITKATRMHSAISGTGHFAVSVLGADQEDVARYFADRRRPSGLAQFSAVDWIPGPRTGAPVLDGSLAWMECGAAESYEGGDHSIFLGNVLDIGVGSDVGSLVFFDGDYHRMDQ